ncbi:MAG: hypothetical protein ACRD22_19885, partial [Terriglobia bacterium]
MNKSFLWLFLTVAPLPLLGQNAVHTSTVTLGVGGQPYSYNYFDEQGGPAFSGRYEYRLSKYLAVDAGVDTLLPSTHSAQYSPVINTGQPVYDDHGPNCRNCVIVSIPETARVTLIPFGFKGILPLASGRVELFAGLGGAYAVNSEHSYGWNRDAWLGQASFGARIALDRSHRFWLGTALHGYSNFGNRKQVWVPWTINLGIRFG